MTFTCSLRSQSAMLNFFSVMISLLPFKFFQNVQSDGQPRFLLSRDIFPRHPKYFEHFVFIINIISLLCAVIKLSSMASGHFVYILFFSYNRDFKDGHKGTRYHKWRTEHMAYKVTIVI